MDEPLFWPSHILAAAGYRALFFGREGGASTGPLAGLNLSATLGDDPAALSENQRRVLATLGADGLYLPAQVHGTKVTLVNQPAAGVVRGVDADAAVTGVPGLAVGVLTADCVPILVGAADGSCVAAIHAGWRGLADGVIAQALDRIIHAFRIEPDDLLAAVGPAIGPREYEVSRHLGRMFLERRLDLMGVIWPDKRRKPHLDLRMMALGDLMSAGLPGSQVEIVGPSTTDPRCFSHRRDHGQTGRQLAAIVMPARGR